MRTIRTPEKEQEFLDALAATCNVTEACKAADIARTAVYGWKRDEPEFSAKWEAALKIGADTLEDEAVRRAKEGVQEPVFWKGDVCGTVRKYSDTLLIFLLKGAKPQKYAERQEHSGPDGGPLIFQLRRIGEGG